MPYMKNQKKNRDNIMYKNPNIDLNFSTTKIADNLVNIRKATESCI